MDKLSSKEFGNICLQLLEQSQIPGNMLDVALKFKSQADALANGQSKISDSECQSGNDPTTKRPAD